LSGTKTPGVEHDTVVAEVTKLDMTIDKGKVSSYRARVNVSFKYIK